MTETFMRYGQKDQENIETLPNWLTRYPKTRPPLPSSYEKTYVAEYVLNREGKSFVTQLSTSLERWMHRTVASHQRKGEACLEIGTGTLNHLQYEHAFSRYDIVEPFTELYHEKDETRKLHSQYTDIRHIQEDEYYDRIFSIAVCEHLEDLPAVVAYSALHLRPNGLFQVGIPSEGGFMWGLAWRLTTGMAYRFRNGLPYGRLMRHEHINTAEEIENVCRYFFRTVNVKRFPIAVRHGSFYSYLECVDPILTRCQNYIHKENAQYPPI